MHRQIHSEQKSEKRKNENRRQSGMTKYEKTETCLILGFEVLLCILKNFKKLRSVLHKKVSRVKKE